MVIIQGLEPIEDLKRKINNKYTSLTPKKQRVCLVVIAIIVILAFVIYAMPRINDAILVFKSNSDVPQEENNNNGINNQPKGIVKGDNTQDNEPIGPVATKPTLNYFVELDSNDSWENFDKFDKDIDNPDSLCPSRSKAFPEGRTMYLKRDVSANFLGEVKLIPQSLYRLNTVIEYENLFRCIIGDGNYQHIACQRKKSNSNNWVYIYEKNGKGKQPVINSKIGIEPQTELTATVESIPVVGSNYFNVVLTIKYIPKNEKIYETEVYEYDIETDRDVTQLNGRVGIGLIGWKHDVCAEFISFTLNDG